MQSEKLDDRATSMGLSLYVWTMTDSHAIERRWQYMWNGTEWVPVEEQAPAPAEEVEAAPPVLEAPTPAVMPQETAVQPVNTAPAMIAPVDNQNRGITKTSN